MYDLELNKIIKEIKQRKAKNVLIQLPDGLKPKAKEIIDKIEKNTKANAFTWMSTCFGGCDIPLETKFLGIDLIIQFGHNKFNKEKW
jgi:2-(3-amino-3-carboxypropyl)histidine synthase